MTAPYSTHTWKFHYSFTYIVERYKSVENFTDMFLEHNSEVVVSLDTHVQHNRLILITQLDGKECYKRILKYGYCEMWMHDHNSPGNLIKIFPDDLSKVKVDE